MTTHKTLKRRVRARMDKTGERYTAARRNVTAAADAPGPTAAVKPAVNAPPPVSDEAVHKATGRGWDEWFAILDDAGAVGWKHPDIARWVVAEHRISGWWAQTVTVGFERARGLRAPGQHADGFIAGVSRTVAVPVEELFAAFHDDERRAAWLPGAEMRLRTATAPRSARYDWEDGESRLVVWFEAAGEAKSRLGVSHERLPDADTADEMKAFWRERLDALKARLEPAAP
jgi:uncharacterized protein YndB with AHSA1/START domain